MQPFLGRQFHLVIGVQFTLGKNAVTDQVPKNKCKTLRSDVIRCGAKLLTIFYQRKILTAISVAMNLKTTVPKLRALVHTFTHMGESRITKGEMLKPSLPMLWDLMWCNIVELPYEPPLSTMSQCFVNTSIFHCVSRGGKQNRIAQVLTLYHFN